MGLRGDEALTDSYSLEAEQSVLGAMLISFSEALLLISDLTEHDFYLADHQKTFACMIKMHKQGETIDFVTVCNALTNIKDIKKYLLQLAEMVPSMANIGAYAGIVKTKSKKRRIELQLQELLFGESEPDALMSAILKIVESERLHDSGNGTEKEQSDAHIDYCENLYKPLDTTTRVYTGYSTIDKKTGGLFKNGMSCLGAPPSTGKTAFAINIINNQLIRTNNRVVFFSLEMSREQIFDRLYSSRLRIPYDAIKNKYTDATQKQLIVNEISAIHQSKQLYIFDNIYTLEEMRSLIAKIKPDLAVIDYIQRVRTVERAKDSRERINFLTSEFKRMAKQCHIMILSQVSRQKDQSGNPRAPRMSDLKESGNIEEDSDIIFMLYRPYVYDKSDKYEPGDTQLLIDKNKHGEAGIVKLNFIGSVQKFEEVEFRYDR